MSPSEISELAWAMLVSAVWFGAVAWALVFAFVVSRTAARAREAVRRGR